VAVVAAAAQQHPTTTTRTKTTNQTNINCYSGNHIGSCCSHALPHRTHPLPFFTHLQSLHLGRCPCLPSDNAAFRNLRAPDKTAALQLISSLFPSNVHDKVLKGAAGGNNDGGGLSERNLIASFYPATTVLFADLAGFTAWSWFHFAIVVVDVVAAAAVAAAAEVATTTKSTNNKNNNNNDVNHIN
jgi:hypothetical protein